MALVNERLQRLLKVNDMSYQDLADRTGIHKATLHRYCQGVTDKVPIDRLWQIAFALGTTPQYLMGDTDDSSPKSLVCEDLGHSLTKLQEYNDILKRIEQDAGFKFVMDSLMGLKTDQLLPLAMFIQAIKN